MKFYLGGDARPGSSDPGYGIMLTEPVRSAISLNPDSGILIGFREVPGSKPFDGARAATYNSPYQAVVAGEDIGFAVEAGGHDAGLMMQWDLGSAPGVQHAALEHVVAFQGTNLDARFDRATATTDEHRHDQPLHREHPVGADRRHGPDRDLPAGLRAVGDVTSGCGGTVTGTSTSVSVVGASVAAAANCAINVPVRGTVGTHELNRGVATTMGDLVNRVGTTRLVVSAPVTPPGTPPVTPPTAAPSVRLHADTDVAPVGGKVRLHWSTTGAERVRAEGSWSETLPARGTRVVKVDRAGTASFKVRATNAAGSTVGRVRVRVLPPRKVVVRSTVAPVIPGAARSVRVRGLSAGEAYTVRIAGRVVARGRADSSGRAVARFAVPTDQGSRVRLVVRGAVRGRVGVTALQVAVAAKLPLRVTPGTVRASDRVRVLARLLPRERATLRYRGKVVATGHADKNGRFRASFTVGQTWGKRAVTVHGVTGQRVGRATITVVRRCFVAPRICD